MICPNCSRPLVEGARFCEGCGTPVNTAPAQPVQTPNYNQAPNHNQAPNYNQGYSQPNYGAPVQNAYAPFQSPFAGSSFNGSVLDTFVAGLVASLIISFTCGIATPWAVTYFLKFIFDHTTIDGKKLTFVGNGADLFGQWIIWALLTAVTCGIYSFWVAPKMYNWIAKNTHFVN